MDLGAEPSIPVLSTPHPSPNHTNTSRYQYLSIRPSQPYENLEVPEVLAVFNSVEKMASSRNRPKKHSSSPSSATSTEGQNRGATIAMNTFANDGSFLELFKKRMEAESQKLQQKAESTVEQTVDREVKAGKEVGEGSCQEKLSEGKAPGPSVSISQQVWLSEERILGFYHFGRTSEPV